MNDTSALTLPNLMATTTPAQLEEEHSIVGQVLVIRWRVTNLGDVPIFIYDRPWRRRKGVVAADEQPCVRLLDRDALELRYGAAPLPRAGAVHPRFVPHTTEVLPGCSLERQLELPLHTSEYSPYSHSTDQVDGSSTIEPFVRDQIKLVVAYVDAHRATDRRSGVGGAVDFQRAAAVYAGAVLLSAKMVGIPVHVTPLRDRGALERGCTS